MSKYMNIFAAAYTYAVKYCEANSLEIPEIDDFMMKNYVVMEDDKLVFRDWPYGDPPTEEQLNFAEDVMEGTLERFKAGRIKNNTRRFFRRTDPLMLEVLRGLFDAIEDIYEPFTGKTFESFVDECAAKLGTGIKVNKKSDKK